MEYEISWIQECAKRGWLGFDEKGILCAGNVPLPEIAYFFGTPCYIYSAETIINNVQKFKLVFAKLPVKFCYAVKANSNQTILKLIKSLGVGAEVVSVGELFRAINAGFPTQEIIFTGVGKSTEEIVIAIRCNLKAIIAESVEEIKILKNLGRKVAKIGLRVNFRIDASTHPYLTTAGAGTKFGIDLSSIARLIKRWPKELEFAGFHIHIGSQIREPRQYRDALRLLSSLVEEARFHGLSPEFIDLGGGFSIPYQSDEDIFPLSELREALLAEEINVSEIVFEPGRAFVGNAGILLTKVLYRKRIHNQVFYIVDAGMNDLIRPSLYNATHLIIPIKCVPDRLTLATVAGPICESADVFAHNVPLPWLKRGDLLAILDAGAYGFAMSSQYNSRPRAVEILIYNEHPWLIRARETVEDLWQKEVIPDWLDSG